jgi:hypothetical protein
VPFRDGRLLLAQVQRNPERQKGTSMSDELTQISGRANGQWSGDSRNASVDPSAAPDLSDYAQDTRIDWAAGLAHGFGRTAGQRSLPAKTEGAGQLLTVEHTKWRASFNSAVAAVVGWPRRLVARARVEAMENFELQHLGASERRDLIAIGVRLPPMRVPAGGYPSDATS